jgi:hypothetical protein
VLTLYTDLIAQSVILCQSIMLDLVLSDFIMKKLTFTIHFELDYLNVFLLCYL